MTIEPIENKICIKCKWNHSPFCYATKIDGAFMRNDNLKPTFTCGQKESDIVSEFWVLVKNPNVKTVDDELIELKERLTELESKITTESIPK